MLLPFVARDDDDRSTDAPDDRARLGRERGVARRRRRRDVRGVPRLVRDDVLRLLRRAAARALLPHHPRRLVRVAIEEREPAAGGRSGPGATRSAAQARRSCGASGSPISCPASRSTPTANFAGDLADLFSAYTVFAGIAVVLLFAFHGATFLTLRTVGDLTRACRCTRPAGSRFRPPSSPRRSSSWTVAVAIDRQRQGPLPAGAARDRRDRGAWPRGPVSLQGRTGRAFAMTGLGDDRLSSRRSSRASIRA